MLFPPKESCYANYARRVQMQKLLRYISNCRVDVYVNAELYRGKCRYRFCSKWIWKLPLSLSFPVSISQRISDSSLDCGVKSITVLMRWHRAYIIFLWISISADTSQRRGSSNEMQMARYVNANLPSGQHEHNEGVRSRWGFCDANTLRSLSFSRATDSSNSFHSQLVSF